MNETRHTPSLRTVIVGKPIFNLINSPLPHGLHPRSVMDFHLFVCHYNYYNDFASLFTNHFPTMLPLNCKQGVVR